MGRKRITGRFYVFLILLLFGMYFVLRELLPDAATEAIVTLANATYSRTVDAVIVRDEPVSSCEGTGRIVFLGAEGTKVNVGDEVCEVYSAGYSEKEQTRLETVRQSIRAYHRTILDNIVDRELERLEARVQFAAVELKRLVARKSDGSLLNLQSQLQMTLNQRQEYLRQNRREDPKLNALYEEEQKRQNAIASWKTIEKANQAGILSFYLDGLEQTLTPGTMDTISSQDIRNILAGRPPTSQLTSSRLRTNLFRVVSTDRWYVILLSTDALWNPINGQIFTFQIEGYPDVAYTGTVVKMQKSGNEVMTQLEVIGTPGPLINRRFGKANIGTNLSGMSVPVNAVAVQNGQTGVWLSDLAGGTFIPVNVLSSDNRYALVQPLAEGTLTVGQRVLIR